jgi:transposase-like protein
MACQVNDNSNISAAIELLTTNGLEGLGDAVSILINHAMELQRREHLNANPYERSEERNGYANGFKEKHIKTRIGKLSLKVPQVRDSSFYPTAIERGMRSERALKLAVAEMYVQGVATRRVKAITEELCGFEVSSTDVSRAANLLDDELELWRERPLGAFEYLFLDARYEKVRRDKTVTDSAVLVAYGVGVDGKRRILGVSVALSEQEVHWRTFLTSLVDRGLHGVKLITSDAHTGLKAAKQAVFPSVPWQRCQFHLQQNAQSYAPKKAMKKEIAADIRAVFNAPDDEEAKRLLKKAIKKYEASAPELSSWMERSIPESLTVFQFPAGHRRKLRTSNVAERVNRELKRRTRLVSIFANVESCLRLVSALAAEIDEEWQTGRNYMIMNDDD